LISPLGDASLLTSSIPELFLLTSTVLRPGFFEALHVVPRERISAVDACLLTYYAVASAIIMPMLFAGDVTAHVPINGVIIETPLAPVNGNITQTAYLLAGITSKCAMKRQWVHPHKVPLDPFLNPRLRTRLLIYSVLVSKNFNLAAQRSFSILL
jgi:hypothetical protein